MTLSAVDPQLAAIAASFAGAGAVASVRPLGNGNINATYLVRGEAGEPFVLQRLNGTVFPNPERVMGNLLAIGEHVERRLGREEPDGARRRWVVPKVRPTVSGQPWLEAQGALWRAISYVPDTVSREALHTPAQAREVGYGLGRFHELLHDLPCERLADTLPGFHITPGYLARYEAICAAAPHRSGADPEREALAHRFIAERQGWADVLERAKAAGKLPERPIHGDPKVNNVLLDARSGEAVALVDLDTVKPGLVHYDIGDALRSGCNPLGEETLEIEAVRFDLALCEALLEGYGAMARRFLTAADHRHLYDAIRLISFELGLRFFSDHLAGDVYFHTQRAGQNLDRALVQFQLTASIEAQEREIRALLARLEAER